MGPVMETDEGGHAGVDHEHDVAATAAVAAIGAAQGLELLTVDRSAAVTAVTGGGVEVDPVDECGHRTGPLSYAVE